MIGVLQELSLAGVFICSGAVHELTIPSQCTSYTSLQLAVCLDDQQLLQLLLEHAADPTTALTAAELPLHIAAAVGSVDSVATLLHAQPLLVHQTSATAAHTALHFGALSGSVAVVKLLLKNSASPSILNAVGSTPAEVARSMGHRAVVELLSACETRTITAGIQHTAHNNRPRPKRVPPILPSLIPQSVPAAKKAGGFVYGQYCPSAASSRPAAPASPSRRPWTPPVESSVATTCSQNTHQRRPESGAAQPEPPSTQKKASSNPYQTGYLRQVFELIDLNRDGELTRAEVIKALKTHVEVRRLLRCESFWQVHLMSFLLTGAVCLCVLWDCSGVCIEGVSALA